MNESRVFMLNGTEVSQIVTRLENFFRTEKGMEVQSSQTTEGYVMQASQPKDGWKTLTGMRLAITAGMGAFKQKKLPGEVFQVIETTIMTGGQPVVVTGAGQTVAVGMIVCPSCKAQLAAGSKFCNHCGTKLNTKCPNCGVDITQGSAFCSECGQKL